MKRHKLKVWPEFMKKVISGEKTFEVRFNDRGFEVADVLDMQEWSPDTLEYRGEVYSYVVKYILFGGQFGIEEGFVVMSLSSRVHF